MKSETCGIKLIKLWLKVNKMTVEVISVLKVDKTVVEVNKSVV